VATITEIVTTNVAGLVTRSGVFIVSHTVQITASISNNGSFLSWSDGMPNNLRAIGVGASGASCTANFVPPMLLTTLASPPETGVAACGGIVYAGLNALLSVKASNGWLFIN